MFGEVILLRKTIVAIILSTDYYVDPNISDLKLRWLLKFLGVIILARDIVAQDYDRVIIVALILVDQILRA